MVSLLLQCLNLLWPIQILLFQQWATFARMWWLYDAKWQCPFQSAPVIIRHLQGQHKPIYHPLGEYLFLNFYVALCSPLQYIILLTNSFVLHKLLVLPFYSENIPWHARYEIVAWIACCWYKNLIFYKRNACVVCLRWRWRPCCCDQYRTHCNGGRSLENVETLPPHRVSMEHSLLYIHVFLYVNNVSSF